jgi:hypothetical protein
MSVHSEERAPTTADAVAGFLAATAIAAGLFSIVWRPSRIGPVALVIALVAVGMSGRNERLGAAAVAVVAVGWVLGMIFAVLTDSPVY